MENSDCFDCNDFMISQCSHLVLQEGTCSLLRKHYKWGVRGGVQERNRTKPPEGAGLGGCRAQRWPSRTTRGASWVQMQGGKPSNEKVSKQPEKERKQIVHTDLWIEASFLSTGSCMHNIICSFGLPTCMAAGGKRNCLPLQEKLET